MTYLSKPIASLALLASTAFAGGWTAPVEVHHDVETPVAYRAALVGDQLVVQVEVGKGWKTFCMDNERRAEEKLAGRQSLGGDMPTQIAVTGGLAVEGGWRQTAPKEFSKPEILWFSWGYDDRAVFAAKARREGSGPARVAIRGQACTDKVCKGVDVEIELPLTGGATARAAEVDLKPLISVRR